MKEIIFQIPENLLSASNPAITLDTDLSNYEMVEHEYTLIELTSKKKYWTDEVKARSQSLLGVKERTEVLQELLIEFKAALFNRAMVKEAIGVLNSPIYANMFFRENSKDMASIMTKLRTKYGAKSDVGQKKIIKHESYKSEENKVKSEKILTEYNTLAKMKVKLLKT